MAQVVWFKNIGLDDVKKVGGKNASLGEMIKELSKEGVNVPDGFATTSSAYFDFLEKAGIKEKIENILSKLDVQNVEDLDKKSTQIREIITNSNLSQELKEEIVKYYKELSQEYGEEETDVAVRSSATAEDMPTASFAGLHETFLNVSGEENLVFAVKKCISSLFTSRAISYREEKGFAHMKVALSVGIQKMARSDLACSGVMFTLDTESGFPDVVLINGTWGLGEMIVQGEVIPDEFLIAKKLVSQEYPAIVKKECGTKSKKMIYQTDKGAGGKQAEVTKVVDSSQEEKRSFTLSDKEILQLGKWGMKVEEHYSKKAGEWRPMDIEWAKDGKSGRLFLIQARPETVYGVKGKERKTITEYKLKEKGKVLAKGIPIGDKIDQGKVNVIKNVDEIGEFQEGQVLVTEMTDPDWEPIMKKAAAIVTDKGGRTCFSGDTKILTNKGYLSIKDITEIFKREDIKVLSLNRETLRLEWKKVIDGMKLKDQLIDVNISQTGRMKDNTLRVTPDHEFLTFRGRKLVSKEIQKLLEDRECVLSCQQIPSMHNEKSANLTPELSYLLGGISTDGHIYLSETHGEVQFIQKETSEKFEFIRKMNKCLEDLFDYSFHCTGEVTSRGVIRGRPIRGSASRYRCYSKEIATYLRKKQRELPRELLTTLEENLYSFLAGVIDGDGTYNQKENKIGIFCSTSELLEVVNIACMRLGISFYVSGNRDIWHFQIVSKVPEILKYTSRVKGKYERLRFGTRFFAAKQILEDIKDRVNYKGRIKPYIENNLLIDVEKIRDRIIPLIKGSSENHALTQIISSPLKMLRVGLKNSLGVKDVYNIEVEDNHNYVVFTSRYTPIIVENCHSAIVSRELGIPCVVGTRNGSENISSGKEVTIDCSQAEKGRVFEGKLSFEKEEHKLEEIPNTKTKINLNIGAPDSAFRASFLPNDGVGLAREEFVFISEIKIHPLALLNPQEVSRENREEIDKITAPYETKKDFFVEKLAQGISRIATGFYPKEVVVRFSDFKTNEYAQLIGGEEFEPSESNPMLGWRGASRYYSEEFKEAFLLECKAVKKAREEYGFSNIAVMIPFCRTPEEARKTLKLMKEAELISSENVEERGKKDPTVYIMCEIPSNVMLADEFLKLSEGFSIGTNDLTQLTLGMDRDSAIIAEIADERNEAVKELVSQAVARCNALNKYSGICGDAPSTFKSFARFLVNCGIQSISVNPGVAIKTHLTVAEEEKKKSDS